MCKECFPHAWTLFPSPMIRCPALLFACVLLLAGCGALASGASPLRDVVRNTSHEVTMRTDGELRAGQLGSILLEVTQAGRPVDLVSQHRSFHVVVASEDLQDLHHTFSPDRLETGVYRVRHVFRRAGPYRVRVEIDDETKPDHHYDEADLIAEGDLTVGGSDVSDENWLAEGEVAAAGYRVTLAHPPLRAGEPASFSYEVRDASGATLPQRGVTDGDVVEPAIYVIAGRNFSFMEHGHPLPGGTPVLLPAAGEYLLWTEFYPSRSGQPDPPFAVPFRLRVLP